MASNLVRLVEEEMRFRFVTITFYNATTLKDLEVVYSATSKFQTTTS